MNAPANPEFFDFLHHTVPGDLVRFHTSERSWFVTRLTQSRANSVDHVLGVMIHSGGGNPFAGVMYNPTNAYFSRCVRLGDQLTYGIPASRSKQTGPVLGIYINQQPFLI